MLRVAPFQSRAEICYDEGCSGLLIIAAMRPFESQEQYATIKTNKRSVADRSFLRVYRFITQESGQSDGMIQHQALDSCTTTSTPIRSAIFYGQMGSDRSTHLEAESAPPRVRRGKATIIW